MKNKINYQVYNLSIMDILFNNNTYTDLGKYVLEYRLFFDNIFGNEDCAGFAALAIAVKLINKCTDKIEWGNVYYKSLSSSEHLVAYSPFNGVANIEKFKQKFLDIFNGTDMDKLAFINKNEARIFNKSYHTESSTSATVSSYFENLNGRATDGWPTISLNGRFPKDAIDELNSAYQYQISQLGGKHYSLQK